MVESLPGCSAAAAHSVALAGCEATAAGDDKKRISPRMKGNKY